MPEDISPSLPFRKTYDEGLKKRLNCRAGNLRYPPPRTRVFVLSV